MRLSPRLKARRGRFGASGLKGPTLLILGPGGELIFGPGSPNGNIVFTGSSNDDLDGDLSDVIDWTAAGPGSPLNEAIGSPGGPPILDTGASVDLSGSLVLGVNVGSPVFTPHTFTIIATVADSGGASATRTLDVTVESYANYPPNLTFVSPAGSPVPVFGPGSPLNIPSFVATSIDFEDGDISSTIEWTVQGPGSPGITAFGSPTLDTGASVDLSAALVSNLGSPQGPGSPFEASSFRVIARTIDSGGKTRTASITVNVIPAITGSPLT